MPARIGVQFLLIGLSGVGDSFLELQHLFFELSEVDGSIHDVKSVVIFALVAFVIGPKIFIKCIDFVLGVFVFQNSLDSLLESDDVLLVELFVLVFVLLVVSELLAVVFEEGNLALVEVGVGEEFADLCENFLVFVLHIFYYNNESINCLNIEMIIGKKSKLSE